MNWLLFLVLTSAPPALTALTLIRRFHLHFLSPTIIFLAGLIVFQSISPSVSLLLSEHHGFSIRESEHTRLLYLFYYSLFLIGFTLGCFGFLHWRRLPYSGASRVASVPPRSTYLLVVAIAMMGIGIVLAIMSTALPGALGHLASLARFGVLGGAGVVAGLICASDQHNFVPKAIALMILGICAFLAFDGVFGRRPLLSVGVSFIFGFIMLRPIRFRGKNAVIVIILCVAAFLLLSFVSGSRTHQSDVLAGEQRIDVSAESFKRGSLALVSGQDTGSASFWIIENLRNADPDYLGSLKYALLYPVPRDVWDEKPIPLSSRLHYLAGFRRDISDVGSTRGPGVVGHGVAEGGVLALLVYGFLLGYGLRRLDCIQSLGSSSLSVVVAVGATAAYILGFARGDLGSAVWRWTYMFLVVFLSVRLIRSLIFSMGKALSKA